MDPKYMKARGKICDEIIAYTDGKQAQSLKDKYAPKALAVEIEPAGSKDDELDAESLARLAAMAE